MLTSGRTLCIVVRGLVCAALLALTAERADAQPTTHVYGMLGAGPAELSAGVDWLIGGGRVGIQAEAGVFAVSVGPTYHFFDRDSSRRLDLFANVDYLAFTDLNYEDVGVSVGGGAVYWKYKYVGFRLNAFGFVPVKDRIQTAHHHWGIQGGIAFSFHSVGSQRGPK